jgi:hypothetical protein
MYLLPARLIDRLEDVSDLAIPCNQLVLLPAKRREVMAARGYPCEQFGSHINPVVARHPPKRWHFDCYTGLKRSSCLRGWRNIP